MVLWSRSSSGWDASEETRLSSNMGICIMEKEEICLAACGESLYENTVRASPEKPECSCKNITTFDYSQHDKVTLQSNCCNPTIVINLRLKVAWMIFPHLSLGKLYTICTMRLYMYLFLTSPDRHLPSVALRVEGPICESFSADRSVLRLRSRLKYAFCICLLHIWLIWKCAYI